ncbi:GEVED domain-containing protein [Lacinutrix himadriensis]|uniref:GEVED domain-containing protein n=1 Tax=Lacinutrix himadriensis TaxID=641549 RepID=UPI00137912CB|nr:GEVED domain-containing protein [Lacinutrix himadriensis]
MTKTYALNLLAFLCAILSCYSQWTENFESPTSTGYGTGTITINGRVWTRSNAGNFDYANTSAGSKGFTINDDKSNAHITTPVLNTCGTVTFDYAYINGNSSNVFELQTSTDGTTFTTVDTRTLGAASNQNYTNYSFNINSSNTTTYIRILSDNKNAHLFIDNFSVTAFAASGPNITATPANISGLDYVINNGPSTEQSFNVTGTLLTAGIDIIAPTNFEISDTAAGPYSSTVNISALNANSSNTIYVRLKTGLTIASYSGTISMTNATSGVTSTPTVAVSGEVTDIIYCDSTPSSNDNSGISSVTVGSVTFPVTDVTQYTYTGAVPDVTQGITTPSSITFETLFTYDTHIWIDLNNDGVFDNTTEKVFTGESANANPTTLTTDFNLGATAALGQHKMRIGTADSGQGTPNSCYSGTYGVTIDLEVNIIAATTDTQLNFTTATYTADESDTSVSVCVDIINPSATATTANIVMTSTTTTHISSYTQAISFPANSSAQQCVNIPITNNTICGDDATYTFEIQNVSGGSNASVGNIYETTLSINDNDAVNATIIDENFSAFGNFTEVSETGPLTWSVSGGYAQINGYGSGSGQRDWLIYNSAINFDNLSNASLVIDYQEQYSGNNVEVFYSTNFNGTFSAANTGSATWTSLGELEELSSSGSWGIDTKTIDLSGISGSSVYIGLLYTSASTSNAESWRIDNVELTAIECSIPAPEINILGNATDIPDGNTAIDTADDTDFGDVLISSGAQVHTFTIENTGDLVLNISSIVSNLGDFTIGTFPATIAANSSTTFTVSFDPSTVGTQTATITITSDDANESTYNFNVEGNGTDIPSIVLSSSNPAVTATNIQADANVTNTVIYAFALAVTNYQAELTAFNFTTSGTALTSDITNFEAYYSTDNTFNAGTDTSLGNITTALAAGTHSFSGFSQTISNGSTGYIFITADIPCGATNGNTILVEAITPTDFSFTSGSATGTAYTSGTHSITEVTPNNVTALATTNCENGSVGLSWTGVTGCLDNYVVVASTTTETAPTGNSFTANTVYGSGTAYGNGYVVYQGTTTSTSITGLTNGTQYYYTVFTKNGDSWSTGVNVDCTPTLAYCDPGSWSSSDSEIEGVVLTGENNAINNITSNICTNTVQDNTAMTADLYDGGSYTLTVEFGDCNGGNLYYGAGAVWIDWNQDGDFDDADEQIGTYDIQGGGANEFHAFTINVPSGQALGNYRMRIVQDEYGTEVLIDPCTSPGYGTIADYTVEVIPSCTPTHTFTSMLPTTGPEETEITVTGTGFTTSTTANFGGVTATVDFIDASTLIVHVPAGAATSNLTLTEAGCRLHADIFTILEAGGTCYGPTNFTDLIISEVYDSEANNVWYMELYNPTENPIDLSTYAIERYSEEANGGTGGITRTIALSGTLAPHAVYTMNLGTSSSTCTGIAYDVIDNGGGINASDSMYLTNNGAIIDAVDAPAEDGYSILRDPTATGPTATYNAGDWTTATSESCDDLGIFSSAAITNAPLVSSITNTSDCAVLDFSVTATEGDTDTLGDLTYQWYYHNAVNDSWIAVTNTSPAGYTILGEDGDNLLIGGDTNPLSNLFNYQFYCEVTEAGTCVNISNAEITKASATTWNGTTWSNNAPNLNTLAIIDGDYDTSINGSFSACSLLINAGKTLVVTKNEYAEIYFEVTNYGTFNILDSGSLVQIDDNAVNSGNISMQRTTSIRKMDYVYWSSPISGFNTNNISPASPTSRIYSWNPTVINGNSSQGNWISAANTTMTPGVGYIVRGPNTFNSSTATGFTATFNNGIPLNGEHNVTISRGANPTGYNVKDDNWNLLGNPYPSAISAIDFLNLNTNVEGAVNIWTHGTLPSTTITDPFYYDFAANYDENDYLTYNLSGPSTGPGTFNGQIGAAQGFMVNMVDGAAASETVIFNNSLRNITLNNSEFYRTANTEKNRIWLDLVPEGQPARRILVGYIENATMQVDRLYDAQSELDSNKNFYSVIDNEAYKIQGRALPFVDTDVIPLGIKATSASNYSIALFAVDGLFETEEQNIYLKDNALGYIHNLKNAPYTFSLDAGVINNRFEIVFHNNPLSIDENQYHNSFTLIEQPDGNVLFSTGNDLQIKNVKIYDVLGRLLYNLNGNSSTEIYNLDHLSQAAYVAKVTLSNNMVLTKKAVKK